VKLDLLGAVRSVEFASGLAEVEPALAVAVDYITIDHRRIFSGKVRCRMVEMECSVCGQPAPLVEHYFQVGSWDSPGSTWGVLAPLWFKATDDFHDAVAGFCSAACSLIHHRREAGFSAK
jgi:hypothetical protein